MFSKRSLRLVGVRGRRPWASLHFLCDSLCLPVSAAHLVIISHTYSSQGETVVMETTLLQIVVIEECQEWRLASDKTSRSRIRFRHSHIFLSRLTWISEFRLLFLNSLSDFFLIIRLWSLNSHFFSECGKIWKCSCVTMIPMFWPVRHSTEHGSPCVFRRAGAADLVFLWSWEDLHVG